MSHPQAVPSLTSNKAEDIWQKAVAFLDEDLRASLNFNRIQKHDVLTKTLKTAEAKKQICLHRRWKFKKGGKDVVVRDILEKIIRWLDYFKEVGDSAVQYDPAHASLPWAGVRFLLNVAVSDAHVFGAAVDGLEEVSRVIARYSIFQQVHLGHNTHASTAMEPALIYLYAEILVYLAKAKKYFESSTAGRIVKSTLRPFDAKDYPKLGRISEKEAEVNKIANLSDRELINQLTDRLRGLEQPVLRMADQAAIFSTSLQESRYREILDWLSPVNYGESHRMYCDNCLDGSQDWLLTHQDYLSWISSSVSSTFLLHGMAGCGKSSLASAVINSLTPQAPAQASSTPLAYFYCSKNASEVKLRDPQEILRSLIRQLCIVDPAQSTLHDAVVHEYERREREAKSVGFDASRLSSQDCVKILLAMTGPNPATIVIDGIDEVEANVRHALINSLDEVIQRSGSVVKVFATSRDDDQITKLFSSGSMLRVTADLNSKDMDAFIDTQVNSAVARRRLLGGSVSNELKQELKEALKESAGEIFQLVIWQMEHLCTMQHQIDVRHAAQRFSEDTLNTLYSGTIAKIHEAGLFARSVANATFAALLCLHEPLSSSAFIDALRYMDMDVKIEFQLSELPRICHHLVVFDTKTDKVRFAHTSIQEFFQGQPRFSPHAVNSMIAKACLNAYMYGLPVGLEAGLQPRKQFYHYGALYWPEHCKQASPVNSTLDLLQAVEDFMFDDNDVSLAFRGWLKDAETYSSVIPRQHLMARALSDVTNPGNSPIFTASVFGLLNILDRVIQSSNFGVDHKNDVGATGLYLACACGHEAIASVFLENGADPNVTGGKFGCPLQAACFNGFVEIAKLLLGRGADPTRRARFDNALQASLEGGSEELALIILEDRSRFNIADQSIYDKALQMAAQVGFEAVVRYLQGNYLSFAHSGPARSQAIENAISKGQLRALLPFIDDTQGQRKDLPADSIAIAALHGQDRIIQFLLEKGFVIEESGPFGKPVRAASLRGHDSTVHLLIERGASVSGSDSTGNALEAAAMNGHTAIAAFLLRMGVDANACGGLYGTALQAAALRGSLGVAKLLLDAGARVERRGSYQDAFHAAAAGGSEEVIVLLLDRGFPLYNGPLPQALNRISSTPYKSSLSELDAPYSQHHSVDRRTTSRSSEDSTVLATAASNGHRHVVELILRNLRDDGAKPKPLGLNEAILEASSRGYAKVVHTLLESGLDAGPELPSFLRESLKRASQNGHVDCVKALIPRVEPYGWTSNFNKLVNWTYNGRSPSECRHQVQKPIAEVVVQRLEALHSLQQLDKKDHHLRGVLLSGCRGDHIPIVELALGLLGPHCSAVQMHQVHMEAFLVAAEQGSVEVMGFLLRKLEMDTSSSCSTIHASSHSGSSQKWVQITDCDLDHIPRHDCLSQTLQAELNDALICAAHNGHFEAVQFLLSRGADARAELQGHAEDQGGFCSLCGRKLLVLRPTPLRAALSGFKPCEGVVRQHNDDTAAREALSLLLLQHGAAMNLTHHDMVELLGVTIQRCPSSLINEMISKDSLLLNTTSEVESALQTAASREIGSAAAVEVILQTDVGRFIVDNAHELSSQKFFRSVLDTALRFFKFEKEGLFALSESIPSVLYEGPGAVVKKLLQLLPGVRTVEHGYALLMQMALAIDDRECVELLLHRGIDVNTISHYYGTALQCASRFGRLDLVRLLLMKGAEVNVVSGSHGTAIQAAILGGHDDVVDVLVEHRAHVKLHGRESAHIPSLATTQLEPSSSSPSQQLPPIFTTMTAGNFPLALSAPEMGVNSDKNGCSEDQPRIAKDSGAQLVDISDTSLQAAASALKNAAHDQNHEMVELLLDELSESPVEERACDDALAAAAYFGDEDICRMILDSGALIPSVNPVQPCSTCECGAVTRSFEQGGSFFEEWMESGHALHIAAYNQHDTVVRLLLARGADANHSTPRYGVPIQAALKGLAKQGPTLHPWAFNGPRRSNRLSACESTVRLLLEYNTDVNPPERGHGSPLQLAAYIGSLPIVQLLLEKGADMDQTSECFGTALMAAAKRGNVHVAESLLQEGADFNKFHASHGTALQVSSHNLHISMVDMLLSRGADVSAPDGPHGSPLSACLNPASPRREQTVSAAKIIRVVKILLRHTKVQLSDLLCAVQAVRSFRYGREVIELLFEHEKDLCITEETLVAEIQTMDVRNIETLRVLLRRDGGLGVTQAMIEAAKDIEVLKVLLKHRPVCQISPQSIIRIARNSGVMQRRKMVGLLIDHESSLSVDEDIVLAVLAPEEAGPSHVHNRIDYLFDRNNYIKVTGTMLKAAATPDDMRSLLKRAEGISVTKDILQCAAVIPGRGGYNARDIVRLLLAHDRSATVKQPILDAFAPLGWNNDDFDYLNLLLERGPDLRLTGQLFLKVSTRLQRWWEGAEVMERFVALFEQHGKNVEFTDGEYQAIAEHDLLSRQPKLLALVHKLKEKEDGT